MPFLNEGDEPLLTIQSIYDSCDASRLEIIAIDDGSDSSITDFRSYPDVTVIRNPQRLGLHACVRHGISIATSENIFRIDGHMRFRNDHWLDRFMEALQQSPNSLFCTTCVALSEDQMELTKATTKYYGADIVLVNTKDVDSTIAAQILEPKWAQPKDYSEYEIPCILGANYLFRKEWYQHIRGLEGLRKWGGNEVSMSLKTWRAGGSCRILKDIEIGHRFRDTAPYATEVVHLYMNKLWMCWTLFDEPMARQLVLQLQNSQVKQIAEINLAKEINHIREIQEYHKDIFKLSMEEVSERINMHLPDKLPL